MRLTPATLLWFGIVLVVVGLTPKVWWPRIGLACIAVAIPWYALSAVERSEATS
ncbi:hypothetical protein [Haladaptatus sp. DJG-WS-42]|uniref:hypothetical protein n=1 Tax=Haladaptatus sp. DJG-WS-42 TaxID=3120516 RepID=UPI0030CD81FC